jgi:hypothetical protein
LDKLLEYKRILCIWKKKTQLVGYMWFHIWWLQAKNVATGFYSAAIPLHQFN